MLTLKPESMESTSKQGTTLELWLNDVQSYLYRMTRPAMEHARFSFSRTDYTYRRKNKKSTDELAIVFLSQFPVNYRVNFQLEIRHPQIRQVKESFMNGIAQKTSHLSSLVLYLKDFVSSVEPDEVPAKDYFIYNHRDLFLVGDQLTQMFQYELVPLCDRLSSLALMDDFFSGRPDWALNTHGGGNICTDLIAAKLNGKRDVEQRYRELMAGIEDRIRLQQISPESRELLNLCYESLKK